MRVRIWMTGAFMFLAPVLARAETATYGFTPNVTFPSIGNITTAINQGNKIGSYIKILYTFGLPAIALLATIVIMVAGILWITAAGSSGRVDTAKDMIKGAVSGLILLLLSYVILNAVNPNLVNLKPPEVPAVGSVCGPYQQPMGQPVCQCNPPIVPRDPEKPTEDLYDPVAPAKTGQYCCPSKEYTDEYKQYTPVTLAPHNGPCPLVPSRSACEYAGGAPVKGNDVAACQSTCRTLSRAFDGKISKIGDNEATPTGICCYCIDVGAYLENTDAEVREVDYANNCRLTPFPACDTATVPALGNCVRRGNRCVWEPR